MVFARLGEEWDINEDLLSALSEFTCALYGKPRIASVNEVRYCCVVEVCGRNEDETLCQPKNFDTSSIPPSHVCLAEHSNFQTAIWKRAHLPEYDIPAPTDGHGWEINEGVLEPKWNSGDILPQNIVDLLLEEGDFEDAEEEDDSDVESDVGSDQELIFSEDSDDED